jgi:hypothetical protein
MAGVIGWIGGGTGSGKTTVTRVLAGRFGLRVFPLDAFWYSHVARLSEHEPDPDEQWLGSTPAEQAAEFESVARRRWPLVLGDVAGLPDRPPVVVEGPQVLPDLVPAGDPAVFLVATAQFQRSVLERRPLPSTGDPRRALDYRIEKDRLFAERIAGSARRRGFPVVTIDGSRSVDEVITVVEQALPGLRVPGGDPGEVSAARRWENDIVADNIRSWLATAHVPPDLPPSYPFACECGRPGCATLIALSLTEYESRPRVLAPGH